MALGLRTTTSYFKTMPILPRALDFEVNLSPCLPNRVEGDRIRHPGGALAVPVTPEKLCPLCGSIAFAVQGRILEFPVGTVEPE